MSRHLTIWQQLATMARQAGCEVSMRGGADWAERLTCSCGWESRQTHIWSDDPARAAQTHDVRRHYAAGAARAAGLDDTERVVFLALAEHWDSNLPDLVTASKAVAA